jgi:hypothetical protein
LQKRHKTVGETHREVVRDKDVARCDVVVYDRGTVDVREPRGDIGTHGSSQARVSERRCEHAVETATCHVLQ